MCRRDIARNRDLNAAQRQPGHGHRSGDQPRRDRIGKREAPTDEPGEQQAHDLPKSAEGLKRADAGIPFVRRPHFDDEHVRHGVRGGEAETKDPSQSHLEWQTKLQRHRQKCHQRGQHAGQQNLPMQPAPVGEMAPERRDRPARFITPTIVPACVDPPAESGNSSGNIPPCTMPRHP